jgi:hypothetical protein
MVSQVRCEFLTAKLDGFGVKAGDVSKVRDRGSVGLVGKRGGIPASLRLSHAGEQEVDLVMMMSKLEVGASLAGAACASMNDWFCFSCHLASFHDQDRV